MMTKEALVLLFRPTRVFLAQEFAQLLPAATNADHDVPPQNPDEYNELITYFVLPISNTDHGKLCWTSALAQKLDNLNQLRVFSNEQNVVR